MNEKIIKERARKKKELISVANIYIKILKDTGIKQIILAKKIGVPNPSLSGFMQLNTAYVTEGMIKRIGKYVKLKGKI